MARFVPALVFALLSIGFLIGVAVAALYGHFEPGHYTRLEWATCTLGVACGAVSALLVPTKRPRRK